MRQLARPCQNPPRTLPLIAWTQRAERDRQSPDQNIAALRETGIFKALQPARYGARPMGAGGVHAALVDLAGACASTAWVTGLLAQHSHMIASMSEDLQDEARR